MIECEATHPEALRQRLAEYLREQCQRLTHQFAPAVDDGDETAIHKCRVALRRMRSVLRQFEELLPRGRRRRAERSLRNLARVLGPIRDLDALMARLDTEPLAALRTADTATEQPVAVDMLREALRAERAQHMATLATVVSPALLGRALVRVTAATTRCDDADPTEWLQRVAQRFLESTAGLLAEARQPEQVERQHEVRIQVKRLRYACELLDPIVPGGLAEEIALAQAAQEGLGTTHDLALLAADARRLVPQRPELVERLDAIRRHAHDQLLAADQDLASGLNARIRTLAGSEPVS